MPSSSSTHARRLIAGLSAVALAGALTAVTAPAATGEATWAHYQPTTDDYYVNYTAPAVDLDAPKDVPVGGPRTTARKQAYEYDRKFVSGNPVAGRMLADRERTALRTGTNPADFIDKQAGQTQEAKLLTLLVEFNPNANDDFTDVMVPKTVTGDRTCVPGKVTNGPVHNQIPDPADAPAEDNNSFWVPDFSNEHYDKMLYSEEGITERVRTDLTGEDGKPGFDISGYTLSNMYEEMSKGAYTVTGDAVGWIQVPHSEGWYGASLCRQNDQGEWEPPRPQANNGHPDNPNGVAQLGIDAVAALAQQQPDFPWAEYDKEDPGDADGDGNTLERDGVVDHLVLVHAGVDKSAGGGAQGIYSTWAHSSTIPGGSQVPGSDVKIANYILQGESSAVGVFAHEYGHDLGLPDLYDTSGAGDSDIAFWDLMASGSHSGPIFQTMPTHMGLWDKWVLGWAEPKIFNPGDPARGVALGQASRTPRGTEDGVWVNLPDKTIELAQPHSGETMWWSNDDQAWADATLAREFAVPQGSDVRFWTWNNYIIEQDWDYGFIEVSTDGGATWEELKVYDEAGNLVSTGDDYVDPNGRMNDYGDKKYGLTGSTNGWRHDYVDLSPYAGQTVQLRLRHATDAAFMERGWFADDFTITADGEEVFRDDVESGLNSWTATAGTFTNTTGEGWVIDTGTHTNQQYYLAEWRTYDGFDEGLKYAYDTTYQRDGAWKVEKIRYNAPGLLVSYRDTTYGETNHTTANSFDLPSIGTKGGLLIVDSHYDPLRREGEAAEVDPTELDNVPQRPQTSNAAFTKHPTYPFEECIENPAEPFSEYCTKFEAQPGVDTFSDATTWYPGVEARGDQLLFRDIDASVVLPSAGNQPYTTRVVHPDGSPATELYGQEVQGHVLGTGDPQDAGVAMGVKLWLITSAWQDRMAIVHVTPPPAG